LKGVAVALLAGFDYVCIDRLLNHHRALLHEFTRRDLDVAAVLSLPTRREIFERT
jgi:hypothetical protein